MVAFSMSQGRSSGSVPAVPDDRAISFGPFCLRPAQQLLLEADTPVRIGARALDLLVALVERAGEVVTKDELFARVWPGLSVDEGNLKTQMALVRKALRDGQAGARYLVSVPGRGYRFVATLSISQTPQIIEPQAPPKVQPALPTRLTRLIGRVGVVSEIVSRLQRSRLITIIGPGGIGKTSVAFAVAEQAAALYDDGICVVDCASLLDGSLVARKLVSTLGLEIAANDPIRGLVAYLRSKRTLIILDCCERVVDAVAVLVENLLQGASGIRILATSREPLRAEGEGVYRLPPLEIPFASTGLTAADALSYPAVQLFVERAASSADRFELLDGDANVVADICRKLDGIALAIELAAGRVDVFGLLGVAARLDDRVRLLTHGRRTAMPRHQTLTAMLDWSYDVLPEAEQVVLRRLAVFVGDFTLDAAHAIAMDDFGASDDIAEIVGSLVSKSLLSADVSTATGLYRLLDTTRAYALKKLAESNEFHQTARRHAAHILDRLERANADAANTRVTGWLSVESARTDEVRKAIDWAFAAGGDVESGIALVVASIPMWTRLSLNGECRRYTERALLAVGTGGEDDLREMQLLAALGAALIYTKGICPEAETAWARALKIAQARNDTDYQFRVLWGMWSGHFNSGQYREALKFAERLRDVAADSAETSATLVGHRIIGLTLLYLGEITEARRHTEFFLRGYVRPRDRSHIIRFQFDQRVVGRIMLAWILWAQGFPDQAMREADGVIEEASSVGHAMSLALALAQAGCTLSLLSGDLAAMERFTSLLLKHSTEHALDLWHDWGKCFGAMLLMARGNTDDGLRTLQKILDEVPQGAFFVQSAGVQWTMAESLGKVGDVSSALATIDKAIARSDRHEERWGIAEYLRVKGDLLRLKNTAATTREAEEVFQSSLDWARREETLSWELRTSVSLARLYQGEGRIAEAHDVLSSIYARFEEGFQTADLKAAKALLNQLSDDHTKGE
jgi:predicted ATPase/DNA-binding winged helix-turn-helix (wHTH) protein